MDPDLLSNVVFLVVLIISLTVHEAAHALVAKWGGDLTAYQNGQVTLNPIPHIREEPFGMLLLPVFMLFFSGTGYCLGFAKTPFNPYWAARHPKRAAWMALAGPMSNFLLAGLAVLGMVILVATGVAEPRSPFDDPITLISSNTGDASVLAAGKILSVMAWLNALLGVFNLFPWPPLDGAGVVRGLFPRQTADFYSRVQGNMLLFFAGILVVWYLVGKVSIPIFLFLRSLVQG
jgi:Zn-dependent protease